MTFQRLAAGGLLLTGTLLVAQEQPDPLPRYRGGSTIVRVDAYITRDGAPLTDLALDDIEILEDDVPQRVESFELIRPRGPVPQSIRLEPGTVDESRRMATDADSRVFVLFMDIRHVQLEGSFRAQGPITRLLDEVIGEDDLVGVMTPEMSARNLTLARRTGTIEGILRDNWFWGERGRADSSDPREQELRLCYPDQSSGTAGLANELIERRREARTLAAMADLIEHLEDLSEARKFVVLLSEGWTFDGRNERLARALPSAPGAEPRVPGGPESVGVDQNGRLTMGDLLGLASYQSCERERAMLAFSDHEVEFRRLLQRANRANVSFYPVDPRGLVAFDDPIGPDRPAGPQADRERLTARQTSLRELAAQTDGVAVLNVQHIDVPLRRMVADTGAYYLFAYYSTNTKLDGRFRRITVRVNRTGVDVRARPGYLAPTEAEAASARVDRLMNGAEPGHTTMPPGMLRAIEVPGSTRALQPLRAQASGGAGFIWFTAELDREMLKETEWQAGGSARVTIEHERGEVAAYTTDVTLEAGQRTISLMRPERDLLAPGRYVIRLELRPEGSSVPLQTTIDAVVPEDTALIATNGIAFRRGPTTGLDYVPTAAGRFRRTERIRLEVPRIADEGTVSARLLNREGQEIPLPIKLAERLDHTLQLRFIVANLTLAPLAQGEYVIEVAMEQNGRRETATYGFRIIP